MDFDLTAEQQEFRDSTQRFLKSESDIAAVRKLADAPGGYDRGWWKSGAEMGWTAILVDEESGGLGLGGEGLIFLAVIAEEMGRTVAPGPFGPTNIVCAALSRAGGFGDTLADLISGDRTAAWAYAEKLSGWDVSTVRLEATKTADGFSLSGVKSPVEAGGDADLFLVTARVDGKLTQFLVPADAPGVTVERLEGLDLVRRFARVRFDNVAVPASAVVGGVGGADDDVEYQLQVTLALQCVEIAGATERVFEFSVEWANDRYSFGRPLSSYQALKHRFADMKTWLEASQAVSWAAVKAIAAGDPGAGRLVRSAKAYVGDYAPEIIQDCIQIHGGLGVTWEHDIHLYLRRVVTNRMLFGNPSEQREAIAAMLQL